jgi:plastocyanin
MKYLNKNLLALLIMIPFLFASCSSEDEVIPQITELNSKVYTLGTKGDFGISGTAKLISYSDATLAVELDLQNTPMGGMHPAHIHFNTAAEGGGIAISLEAVNGDTGKSTTTFTALDDGTSISYQGLLAFNGYINVHLSAQELSTIVAQGNIGVNVNTGVESPTYKVTNTGASAYIFNGEGLSNASNPNFTLKRGNSYTFELNVSGHPFYINTTPGTGTARAYNKGVENNGAQSGKITFTVPTDAPNTLYYNCEFHGSMYGTITIID